MSTIYVSESLKNFPQINFLKQFLIGHPGIIAGGCFKSIFSGTTLHDIDMFFRNDTDFHKAVMYFKEHKDTYTPGYENKNVTSFIHLKTNIRIECVSKIYGKPEEILNQFDFTITKFAYEIECEPVDEDEFEYKDIVTYHPKFFEHLYMKRLIVDDKMPYPISTYNRTYKYAARGFLPCRETKIKILKAVCDTDKLPDDSEFPGAMYEGHD